MSLGRLAEEVFDAVVFDMDGTLIDSTPAVLRAWSIWAVEHGLESDLIGRHHGVPAAGVVRAVLPEDRHEAGIARINELELTDAHDIVVLPGAAEALAAVSGARSAIATSCTSALAAVRIEAAGLLSPPVLVTADDVLRGKPAPDPFLEAARRLGVDPRRTLVVEDAPQGLRAAHAAGCFTLAVTTTTAAADLDADAVVTDLSAVTFETTGTGIRVRLAEPGDGHTP